MLNISPRIRRWLFDLAWVAIALLALSLWQVRNLPEGPAPASIGFDLEGRPVRWGAGQTFAPGRPMLLVFWASWCPICRFEEEALAKLAADWPVLLIATQSGDAAELARYFAARGIALPTVIDAQGEMARIWRVTATPTHFVIDAQGRIRHRSVGYTTPWGLRARLWWAERFSFPSAGLP